ncbi:hypothetical protein [Anaerostipes sp.]|uniref:hypothetical protein n=1 Tax=Anaerostipes sp. TaxID=1872530 RepID=UPI0025C466E2|nr:hypothetical protein [Anaerostipes sp.]MBS7007046.1 hypothetical protein [Anaerostipes sp.]
MQKEQTTYSVEEFASNPQVLAASEDLIRAAFSSAGVKEATERKARKIIQNFKNKEVH